MSRALRWMVHEPREMQTVDVWQERSVQRCMMECPECKARKQYTMKRSRGGVLCNGLQQRAQPYVALPNSGGQL